jgi:phosphoadenosine phosphosulfate reductase
MKQIERYPKFRTLYIRAFDRMIEQRNAEGLPTTWQNGEEVMRWWLKEDRED